MRSLLALVFLVAAIVAGEAAPVPAPTLDQWFAGELNGQPAMSVHLVSTPRPDGGRDTVAEMVIALRRPLGNQTFRLEIRQRQELTEDAQGRVVAFKLDQDENGQRTAAVGTIAGRTLKAAIHRVGRSEPQEETLPEGVEILGVLAGQEALAKAATAGDAKAPIRFAGIELIQRRVAVVRSTATWKGAQPDGAHAFEVVTDLLPFPSTVVVTPRGELVSMAMGLGPFSITVKRSDGPAALLGADIDAIGLVKGKGPVPRGAAVERYRLADPAAVPVDECQTVADGILSVRAEAAPTPLADPAPFLAAEPQLETDDPALRAWVQEALRGHADRRDQADALRLAVRSHITVRDLSTGDGSALETFRNRKGDCTEHANLLCAALRIAGIPARVDVGIVHPAETAGWAGHAWVMAWIDGRWVLQDAAYPGIARSCYIRIGTVSGGDVRTAGAVAAAILKLAGGEIETLAP